MSALTLLGQLEPRAVIVAHALGLTCTAIKMIRNAVKPLAVAVMPLANEMRTLRHTHRPAQIHAVATKATPVIVLLAKQQTIVDSAIHDLHSAGEAVRLFKNLAARGAPHYMQSTLRKASRDASMMLTAATQPLTKAKGTLATTKSALRSIQNIDQEYTEHLAALREQLDRISN